MSRTKPWIDADVAAPGSRGAGDEGRRVGPDPGRVGSRAEPAG